MRNELDRIAKDNWRWLEGQLEDPANTREAEMVESALGDLSWVFGVPADLNERIRERFGMVPSGEAPVALSITDSGEKDFFWKREVEGIPGGSLLLDIPGVRLPELAQIVVASDRESELFLPWSSCRGVLEDAFEILRKNAEEKKRGGL